WLLLLPVLLFLRPTRATFALALVVGVPYLLWFLTAQYTRYLLPTLGCLAILEGAAVAELLTKAGSAGGAAARTSAFVLKISTAIALGLGLLLYLSTIFAYPGALPINLLLGRETPQAYTGRILPSYTTLQQLDVNVTAGAPVAVLPELP